MFTKQEIKNQIRLNAPLIRGYGISKIGLFGSYARQEEHTGSDIDILIDFQDGEETFDNFMATCLLLESIFKGTKVEIVTTNGLSPYIGPHILSEVEYVPLAN